ncbi:MAG: hypothetical protein KF878_00650 [Planctomycetes bacterium]|nr:hypothetical protein [Planctomycetota bacterium]
MRRRPRGPRAGARRPAGLGARHAPDQDREPLLTDPGAPPQAPGAPPRAGRTSGASPDRGPGLGALCLRLYAAALALRALAAARADSLYPDGAVELEVARALAEGRWADALDARFHPLLGALTAPLARAGLPPEGAALTLVVLLSSLVAPLAALTAARLAPAAPLRAAALAGLLAAAQPWLVRLGGQVMAYGPAHAALALALLAAVGAAARPGLLTGGLTGAAIGLGWLARSDALATGPGLALVALVAAGRAGWRQTATVALGLALGAALLMSPYLVAMRLHAGEWRLSLKKRVDQVVRVPTPAPPDGGAPPAATTPSLADLVVIEAEGGDPAAPARRTRATALPPGEAAWVAGPAGGPPPAHPLVLALAACGLLVARGPGRWAAGGARRVPVAVHALLKTNWGYTSVLHQVGRRRPGRAARRRRGPRLGARRRAPRHAALAAVVLFALVHKALEPQLQGKAPERTLGPALRALAGPGPLVLAGHDARVVAHDARADYVDVREVPGPAAAGVQALRARGARHLVVFLRRRQAPPDGAAPTLEAALAPLGVVRRGDPVRSAGEGGVRYDWLVFQLDPAPDGGP